MQRRTILALGVAIAAAFMTVELLARQDPQVFGSVGDLVEGVDYEWVQYGDIIVKKIFNASCLLQAESCNDTSLPCKFINGDCIACDGGGRGRYCVPHPGPDCAPVFEVVTCGNKGFGYCGGTGAGGIGGYCMVQNWANPVQPCELAVCAD